MYFSLFFYPSKIQFQVNRTNGKMAVGLTTYIILLIQSLVGFTQYFTPSLYGSTATAQSIYKYHRASGYLVLVLMLATISAATWTPFNRNALHIKSWAVIACSVLLLIGLVPRIKKQKLGLGSRN